MNEVPKQWFQNVGLRTLLSKHHDFTHWQRWPGFRWREDTQAPLHERASDDGHPKTCCHRCLKTGYVAQGSQLSS